MRVCADACLEFDWSYRGFSLLNGTAFPFLAHTQTLHSTAPGFLQFMVFFSEKGWKGEVELNMLCILAYMHL